MTDDDPWCPERNKVNLCSKCFAIKPCGAMQGRPGLPHGHTPTICRTCRNAMFPKHTDVCACGEAKDVRSKRCRPCTLVPKAPRPRRQPRKSGQVLQTSDGYLVVVARDHPDATSNGTVSQHRLVMEGVIGRRLLPTENVHHLNGDRRDNRPENLELWCRPQPVGVRVTDAVAQALAVLRLYAPDALKETE